MDWKEFAINFTYNTNAIEGSNLSLTDVRNILEKNIIPKEASSEDVAECYGLYKAINTIKDDLDKEGPSKKLTLQYILKLHYIVFEKTKPFAGKFRSKKEDAVIIEDNFGHVISYPEMPDKVFTLMRDIVNIYNEDWINLNEIFRFHIRFENIHPFLDGNGRVGRLLLNYMLLRANKEPFDIKYNERNSYYKVFSGTIQEGGEMLKEMYLNQINTS
ncbi:MAG: Fic family protein [Candidatus Micrarchaeaceae archaeon]